MITSFSLHSHTSKLLIACFLLICIINSADNEYTSIPIEKTESTVFIGMVTSPNGKRLNRQLPHKDYDKVENFPTNTPKFNGSKDFKKEEESPSNVIFSEALDQFYLYVKSDNKDKQTIKIENKKEANKNVQYDLTKAWSTSNVDAFLHFLKTLAVGKSVSFPKGYRFDKVSNVKQSNSDISTLLDTNSDICEVGFSRQMGEGDNAKFTDVLNDGSFYLSKILHKTEIKAPDLFKIKGVSISTPGFIAFSIETVYTKPLYPLFTVHLSVKIASFDFIYPAEIYFVSMKTEYIAEKSKYKTKYVFATREDEFLKKHIDEPNCILLHVIPMRVISQGKDETAKQNPFSLLDDKQLKSRDFAKIMAESNSSNALKFSTIMFGVLVSMLSVLF